MSWFRVSPLLLVMIFACDDGGGSSSAADPGDSAAAADVSSDGGSMVGDPVDSAGSNDVGPGDTASADISIGAVDGPPALPEYSAGQCPTLSEGDMVFTSFGESRSVRIFLPPEPQGAGVLYICLLYTSPSPRDLSTSRMPSSA